MTFRLWIATGMSVALLVLVIDSSVSSPAWAADPDPKIAALEARIDALEAKLETTTKTADVAKAAIAHELAQPMLLLVGDLPCPDGFKRIVTRVMILTRAMNPMRPEQWIAAGLPEEERLGVGDNVYRDLDFCYRTANSVVLK